MANKQDFDVTNPVTITLAPGVSDDWRRYQNPDPWIMEHEGMYYCYTTGDGIDILTSTDLKTFTHMGTQRIAGSTDSHWDPFMLKHNGKFYLYYSANDGTGDAWPSPNRMQVADADSPLGPFRHVRRLFDHWAIGHHLYEKDGNLYMFYNEKGQCPGGAGDGTLTYLIKMKDPYTPDITTKRLVVWGTHQQEKYPGGDYCVEGPRYFEHEGVGFLMYSGGPWESEDYWVGYATCDAAQPLENAEFTKYPDNHTYHPILTRDEKLYSMGRSTFIKGPKGEMLLAYHANTRNGSAIPGLPHGDKQFRRLCVNPFEIVEGRKIVVAPNQY